MFTSQRKSQTEVMINGKRYGLEIWDTDRMDEFGKLSNCEQKVE